MTPFDAPFHAKGDGSDDTKPVQAWLKAIAGKGPVQGVHGTFVTSGLLEVDSDTHIYAAPSVKDEPTFVIRKQPDFPADTDMVRNRHVVAVGGQIVDKGITINGLHLDGVGLPVPMNVCLMAMAGVEDLIVEGCGGADSRWPFAFQNIDGFRFNKNKIAKWGDATPWTPTGGCTRSDGYGLWMGPGIRNYEVQYNDFSDGQWTAILLAGYRGKVIGNTSNRVHEGMIFCPGDCSVVEIAYNRSRGVRVKDCAAYMVEAMLSHYTIHHNESDDTDHGSIILTDSPNGVVHDNWFRNPSEAYPANGVADVNSTGGITLLASQPTGQHMDHVTVVDNHCRNASGKATHAIAAYCWGGQPMTNMNIGGNDTGDPKQWKGEPVLIGPGVRGDGFKLLEVA